MKTLGILALFAALMLQVEAQGPSPVKPRTPTNQPVTITNKDQIINLLKKQRQADALHLKMNELNVEWLKKEVQIRDTQTEADGIRAQFLEVKSQAEKRDDELSRVRDYILSTMDLSNEKFEVDSDNLVARPKKEEIPPESPASPK